jgi:hypothetical protein
MVLGCFEMKGRVGCRRQSVGAVLPDKAGTSLDDVVMAKFCPGPTPSKEEEKEA